MFVGALLRSGAVIVGDDSAESFLSFNFALIRRFKVRAKNFISDIFSLMRSVVVIIFQPFAVDIGQLIHAEADEMIQTFSFTEKHHTPHIHAEYQAKLQCMLSRMVKYYPVSFLPKRTSWLLLLMAVLESLMWSHFLNHLCFQLLRTGMLLSSFGTGNIILNGRAAQICRSTLLRHA